MEEETQPPITSTPPTQTARRSKAFGVTALVLGLIAVVFAFIPFVNYVSGFIAVVGLIFGIIGLTSKRQRTGIALGGTVVSVIGLILSITMAITYTAAFTNAVNKAAQKSNSDASTPISIVYDVTGDSTDATISYSTVTGNTTGSEQATGQKLPFSKTIQSKKGGVYSYNSYSLTASNGQTGSDITCKITVNGKVISTQTSHGQYATVSCSASGNEL